MLALNFSGCAKKAVTVSDGEKQSAAEKKSAAGASGESTAKEKAAVTAKQSAAEEEAGKVAAKSKGAKKKGVASGKIYTVKKGDTLWWIAKYKDNYNDPFAWPIIFDANRKKIKNPNLIYPGQKLLIPDQALTMDYVKKARKRAGAPRPYTPPAEARIPLK